MTKHFRKEVEQLKKRVLHQATLVEENLQAAVRSFLDRDTKLAQKVIEEDLKIDRLEVELEEECLKVLALHQPVAIDLRFIVAALKINNDLERIGDLAVNIAQLVGDMSLVDVDDVPFDLTGMLEVTLQMVKKSADSLVEMDVAMAVEVCQTDDQIDLIYHDSTSKLEDKIRQNPEMVRYYMGLKVVSRHLERIADHATNIAEDVIYMIEGEIVRHSGGKQSE